MMPLPVRTLALVTWSAAAARALWVTFWALLNGPVAPRDVSVGHGRWYGLPWSTSLATGGYEPGGRPVATHTGGGGHAEPGDRGRLGDVGGVDGVGAADLGAEEPDRTAAGQVG